MQRAEDWLKEAQAELRAGRNLPTGEHWVYV